tara:strand:+ start:2394 stop:4781 length:2388 start_codon:yes stop_codon:yes gene_type:complete
MNIQSITAKAWLFTTTFALLLGIQFFVQSSAQTQLKSELILLKEQQLVMLHKTYTLKNATMQVQQWLTSISASRNLNNLIDELELASTYSNVFHTTISELTDLDPENTRQYESLAPIFKKYFKTGTAIAQTYASEGSSISNQLLESFNLDSQKINILLDKMLESTEASLKKGLLNEVKGIDHEKSLLIIFSICFAVLLIILIIANHFVLSRPMLTLSKIIKSMATQQRETGSVNIDTKKLNQNIKTELGSIAYWLSDLLSAINEKNSAALELSNENKRVKEALDACSTNVMMADTNFDIIYMNPAVLKMMQVAEKDLQTELPNFNANHLIGQNIDVFHKNPAHQRSMLAKLTQTYTTTFKVGSRTFSLTATPIFDEEQNRLGTVVEWADKTSEVVIQSEVENLILAANAGDLSKRLDIDIQNGFFKTLSTGLNELMDQVSTFVADVGAVFEAMSEGNLSKKISNSYQGGLEEIKNNANDSLSKLSDVMAKIHRASDIVRSSSQEVAQGSDDLSRRTESQASSLEETAASMEEIASTVKQTAVSATQSNSLASEAKTKAEKGGEVVQGAVSAMSDIMASSNKISDIIGVIDEIAFQTNLLALNAAVEAARAGEQGRGFAVVAGEVRTLSQRSAAAAKEIKDLIRDSVNKVESGSKLVNQSGQMLSEIVQAVDKVAKMIAGVTSAAIEQNSGISQINQAVNQMDEMTQQNAALVEETSAASRSMSEEAKSMSQLISFFQLSHQNGFTDSSTNTAAEPIKTYKASPATTNTPNTPSKPTNNGNKGAASFSSEDDWEDF